MKLENNNHLMYCLNIHPGENWDENLAAIQNYSLQVKKRVSPHKPFALGLRLSAIAANELLTQIKDFKEILHRHNMYVVSINGFPFGPFHGNKIKQNAYLPDWSSYERVSYSLYLARILADLLPEGETGTISTVPCFYGKKEKPSAFTNLLSIADSLSKIKKITGKHIILALEPEPDCFLDDLESTLEFFSRLYSAGKSAQNHLGVCLDTSHTIVEFESPLLWIKKLHQAHIQTPKIQISAALQSTPENQKSLRQIFLPFDDKRYLHQTRISVSSHILRYKDLPEAISTAPRGEWRVHFHVPLSWSGEGVSSTANFIEDNFFKESFLAGGKHFEIETYTFNVLPEPKPPITDSIVSEIQWVKKRLEKCCVTNNSIYKNESVA